jgi:hypothetical protein
MVSRQVRPCAPPLTEEDAREILAGPLRRACSDHGPIRVGKALGCDEKTVRNARDERSTLRLDLAANLLPLDPLAFEGFLARVGRRSVPIGATCDTDDRAKEGSVLKAALALSLALADDNAISPAEIRANRGTIEAARDALDELLAKLTVKAA